MNGSRRTLFAALADRHFVNGARAWRTSKGKSWERLSETVSEGDSQREQLISNLWGQVNLAQVTILERVIVNVEATGPGDLEGDPAADYARDHGERDE